MLLIRHGCPRTDGIVDTPYARCACVMSAKGGSDGRRERVGPLLARAQEAERARLFMARLRGRRLPDVELTTSESMRLPLLASVSALVVFYFVAGEDDETWIDGRATPDASQHRGYVNHGRTFEEMGVKILGVSCQPEATLARIKWSLEASHTIFSDPELILGQALELPMTQDGNTKRYHRMALVASGGTIHKGFGPLSDNEAAGSARQVMTWISATAV
jgi:peroxiredoxin